VLLVHTGQSVNSQPDVQVPMQNCTNIQYFMVHAARSVKVHQVNFPMHLTARHLEFPRWSYCQNTKDCQKTNNHAETHQERGGPFHIGCIFVFVSCFHLSRRSAPCINTPLLHSKCSTLIF
jgi:hypothetical protein